LWNAPDAFRNIVTKVILISGFIRRLVVGFIGGFMVSPGGGSQTGISARDMLQFLARAESGASHLRRFWRLFVR
jgi:hypothetical protein